MTRRKVLAVTGGAQGIGRAIVQHFARHGYGVSIADSNAARGRDELQHPVGRVGTPEDVARACLYLAEDAGFMTGQNITIDGGMTVKMIYAE